MVSFMEDFDCEVRFVSSAYMEMVGGGQNMEAFMQTKNRIGQKQDTFGTLTSIVPVFESKSPPPPLCSTVVY